MKHSIEIYIHGGMFKTGTTAFQRLMNRNREFLISNGIYYPPKTAGANTILNLRFKDWSPEPVWNQIRAAREVRCDKIIFSGEAVSILSAAEVLRLAECLKDYQTHFVFSFRHWTEYLPSRWSTYSSRRDSQPFSAYIQALRGEFPEHIDLYFNQLVDRFRLAGSSFRAVSYSNESAQGKQPTEALFRALDIEPELSLSLAGDIRLENVRRSWDEVELLRLLNGVVARHLRLNQDDLCNTIGTFGHGNIPFVLDRELADIPEEISGPVLDAIRQHEAVVRLNPNDRWLEQLAETFQRQCADSFTNLVDGHVFAAPKPTETHCTDLVWSEAITPEIAKLLTEQPFVRKLEAVFD